MEIDTNVRVHEYVGKDKSTFSVELQSIKGHEHISIKCQNQLVAKSIAGIFVTQGANVQLQDQTKYDLHKKQVENCAGRLDSNER